MSCSNKSNIFRKLIIVFSTSFWLLCGDIFTRFGHSFYLLSIKFVWKPDLVSVDTAHVLYFYRSRNAIKTSKMMGNRAVRSLSLGPNGLPYFPE